MYSAPITSPPDPTDAELLRRAGAGDDAAFAALYVRHAAMVRLIARRIVGDDALAEDVCQEAFLRLWLHRDAYRAERAPLAGWLARIARNLAVDERRRRRESVVVRRDPGVDAWAETVPDRTPGPEETAVARAMRDALSQALWRLPPPDARAVALAHGDGLSHRAVAEALGLTLGRAKHRIVRGMGALRSDPALALATAGP